jgi:hypothetical protein
MKTKDFIKMLQEADPTGEGCIRLSDGIPWVAIPKEGYWDGPYAYIDDNGDYVQSTYGYKIDVWGMDVGDYVETHFDYDEPNNWEKIKSKIKSNTTYLNQDSRDSRHNRLLEQAKKNYDELMENEIKFRNKKL